MSCIYQQINSVDPTIIKQYHKNYVDSRDDNIILLQCLKKILIFQTQIGILTNQVSDMEQNVNQNSEAYYSLQDILSTNDKKQVDIIATILQTLKIILIYEIY